MKSITLTVHFKLEEATEWTKETLRDVLTSTIYNLELCEPKSRVTKIEIKDLP